MRHIFAASDLRDTDLAGLYEYPPGPWLRANMVASADGAAYRAVSLPACPRRLTGTCSRCSARWPT